MVTRLADKTRIYKYDTCRRQQDYAGWKARQRKDWVEEQEFLKVPLKVYERYDKMRMSLVDEVFVTITDTMVDDTLDSTLKRMNPMDHKLLRTIQQQGPLSSHAVKKALGAEGLQAVVRCKARGLVLSKRARTKTYYVTDLTDFGLEALNSKES